MKKTKNLWAKIVAFIALAAIVLGIVWTGILFTVESYRSYNSDEISPEELQELIDALPETQVNPDAWSGELSDEW